MPNFIEIWTTFTARLEALGDWLAPLGLRLILFWEYFEAGREKFTGSNWFMDIQGKFPFPFDMIPSTLSWQMATWTELLGAFALLSGFGTRLAAFSLIVLTIVATAAVHWPDNWMMFSDLLEGYAITDNGHGNYKLPLLFLVMLVPLLLRGAGHLSVDALLARGFANPSRRPARTDPVAWGLAALGFGLPLAMLLPVFGLALAAFGIALLGFARVSSSSLPRSANSHGVR
jgi:putative oxidoreductase